MKHPEETSLLLKPFLIQFSGLKEGIHHFNFKVDDAFFACFENSPIEKANLNVALNFNRRLSFLELNFTITGLIYCECDRCADPLDLAVDEKFELLVKLVQHLPANNDDPEVYYLHHEASEINIANWVYEFAALCLPMHKVHEDLPNGKSGCNPSVIAYLENIETQQNKPTAAKKKNNNNNNNKDNPEETTIDPRWAKLKNLLNED
ncbi:MAG: DUF177 domain-containing protein [Sphingobacteriales bacterium]|nr:DUF177 domain-containing protein [Sphingobacteriales bacterium]MBP9140837.1 DUF177 domain-containing protein [Chitinophagales bacterium]MDA0198377.1 DUF177 domain-containing protein [Bacteroidota bacterium]MBK6891181.1 DUF177 domain-containing protein [Sphingobacteriales bacterium]MBK7526994.1 DUF177 domain-containing protein [Sphingobacteriales bacterium]